MTRSSPRSRKQPAGSRGSAAAKKGNTRKVDEPAGRRTTIRVALIGAAATVLAAAIPSFFLLASTVTGQSASRHEVGMASQPEAIGTVIFSTAGATDIITVAGLTRHLPAADLVYAVATSVDTTSEANSAPSLSAGYYAGGPAIIGSDGPWVIDILGIPANWRVLTVTATEVPCLENRHSRNPAVRWLCSQKAAAFRPPS